MISDETLYQPEPQEQSTIHTEVNRDFITTLVSRALPELLVNNMPKQQAHITIYNNTISLVAELLASHPDKVARLDARINAAIVRIVEEEEHRT